ncbi:hypothetical protein V6Z12_D10G188500 [Gossypium hirsutum]
MGEIFENFDVNPLGSASIAQVRSYQVQAFQHDFVPRDPNAKSKRFKYPQVYDPYGPRPPPSDKVVELVERIALYSVV